MLLKVNPNHRHWTQPDRPLVQLVCVVVTCRSYTLKLYQAPVSRTVELSLEDVEDDDVRRTL